MSVTDWLTYNLETIMHDIWRKDSNVEVHLRKEFWKFNL